MSSKLCSCSRHRQGWGLEDLEKQVAAFQDQELITKRLQEEEEAMALDKWLRDEDAAELERERREERI